MSIEEKVPENRREQEIPGHHIAAIAAAAAVLLRGEKGYAGLLEKPVSQWGGAGIMENFRDRDK